MKFNIYEKSAKYHFLYKIIKLLKFIILQIFKLKLFMVSFNLNL